MTAAVGYRYPNKITNIIGKLPGSLPTAKLPADINCTSVAEQCLQCLGNPRKEDFTQDAIWRDTFTLTGTLRTINSGSVVHNIWKRTSTYQYPQNFQLVPDSCQTISPDASASWLEARFTFETHGEPSALCSGFLSMVYTETVGWQIWMLRTVLEQLNGHADVDKCLYRTPMVDQHNENQPKLSERPHFECVIVGGGQSGLSTAGRLQALDVSYVILEKYANVGDNWKMRYDAVKLHNTRHYCHLPFEKTFTADYPLYLTKNDLARGYQDWAQKYGINIWLSTALESGSWDEEKQQWTLTVRCGDETKSLSASHIVFAVGAGGQVPSSPQYPNEASFQGSVFHSSEFANSSRWAGKRGIVVGTANTAHDIAEDMLEQGMSVTMIQRSRTFVFPVEYLKSVQAKLYNEDFDINLADRMLFSNPLAIARKVAQVGIIPRILTDSDRFDALERAGFRVDRWGDMYHHLNERQGGHYVDVGASAKIAQGLIKVKSDAAITTYMRDGLQFDDGTELKADLIVFATGFSGNIRQTVCNTLGDDIAEQIEDFWGLSEEGEILGAYKPSGHPALWCIGGGCGHSRYYSRFVALQVKASLLGQQLTVFNERQSH